MKWNEFLNDQQLNADTKYHSPPDGEYLFGKIAHDVLGGCRKKNFGTQMTQISLIF